MSELPIDDHSEIPAPHLEVVSYEPDEESLQLSVQLHSEAIGIIQDKYLAKKGKVATLTALAINTYGSLIGDVSEDSHTTPNEVKNYVDLALAFRSSTEPESIIDLEIIDDLIEPLVSISPISVSLLIARLELQYDIPRDSTLAVKLWVLDRTELTKEATSHFVETRNRYLPPLPS